MKTLRILLLSLISIIIYNCENEKAIKASANKLNHTKKANSVIISGVTDDKKAFEYINIIDYSNFFGSNPKNFNKKISNDSLLFAIDSINNPQIMEIMMFGKKPYITRVFVTPTDSIKIKINNEKLNFNGTNSSHYNFYYQLDSLNIQWSKVSFNGSFLDYKKRCKDLYNKRKYFFEKYTQEHMPSKEFITQVQAELKFEYQYNLIAPRNIKDKYSNVYFNNLEGLTNVIANSTITDNNLLNIENYFDNITIEEFNRPELINNDYFKRSLVMFIRHHFTEQEYLDYTKENFINELNFINNNLKGEIAKYAKGRLINDYYQKGFGQDNKNATFLKDEIKKYLSTPLNSSYRNTISDIETELNLLEAKIPKKILDEKLITLSGETVLFSDILKKANTKIKIIDFWAGWCPPCISDIKHSKKIKKEITSKYNVEWIYISVEADTIKWKKDFENLRDYLSINNQYKITSKMKPKLLEFFKVSNNNIVTIPRVVILNSENKIAISNSPRPSDTINFQKTIDMLSLK